MVARPKKADAKVSVPLRLRPLLLQQVDDWATEHGVTRQEALESAIEALVALGGLEQEPEAPKPRPVPKVEREESSVGASVPWAGDLKRGAYQKTGRR